MLGIQILSSRTIENETPKETEEFFKQLTKGYSYTISNSVAHAMSTTFNPDHFIGSNTIFSLDDRKVDPMYLHNKRSTIYSWIKVGHGVDSEPKLEPINPEVKLPSIFSSRYNSPKHLPACMLASINSWGITANNYSDLVRKTIYDQVVGDYFVVMQYASASTKSSIIMIDKSEDYNLQYYFVYNENFTALIWLSVPKGIYWNETDQIRELLESCNVKATLLNENLDSHVLVIKPLYVLFRYRSWVKAFNKNNLSLEEKLPEKFKDYFKNQMSK